MTDRRCTIPDCDNLYRSKGYCNAHYLRARLHGAPTAGAPMRDKAAGLNCSVPECDRMVRCKNMCRIHYERLRNHGRLDTLTADDRFWSHVQVGPRPPAPFTPGLGPCWEWIGATTGTGYGNVWHDGAYVPAHRVSYKWANGEIDAAMAIDHLCRVRNCVNPDHLEQVTTAENNRRALEFRMREAGR